MREVQKFYEKKTDKLFAKLNPYSELLPGAFAVCTLRSFILCAFFSQWKLLLSTHQGKNNINLGGKINKVSTDLHIFQIIGLFYNVRTHSFNHFVHCVMRGTAQCWKSATKALKCARGKSLLELWGTTFLPEWQPPLIFVWFTSKLHMSTSHTIRTHAQEVWDKLDKD